MQILKKLSLLISFITVFSFMTTAQAEIKVVTSIKPVSTKCFETVDLPAAICPLIPIIIYF